MYKITEQISQALTKAGIKNHAEEIDGKCVLKSIIVGKTTRYLLLFISSGEDSATAIRVFSYYMFPRDQRASALEAANACNLRYRYVRFVVHADSISAEYDFPLAAGDRAPAMAVELTLRFLKILDETYPTIDGYFKPKTNGLLN